MNKKFLFIGAGALVVLLIVALIAVSCSSKKTPTTSSNSLTIWNTDDDKGAFDQIITDFQNDNSNIKINYVKKDSSSYATDALNEIAAGRGPDIWAIPNTWLPQYHDKLVAMPDKLIANAKLKKSDTDVYKDTFPNVVSSDNIIKDKIYGMPLAIDTLVLYYNQTIFRQTLREYSTAHPNDNTVNLILTSGPKNWDDFVTIAKIISKKSGDTINASAVAMGTPNNVNRASDILTLLMEQNGAKMNSDDNASAQFQTKQNVFNGGEDFPGTKALEFYAAFANPTSDLYTYNASQPDSLHAFANGQTAMMIDYQSQKKEIKRINSNLEYDVFAVPQIKETPNPVSYASYKTFTVTKASKNSALAWNFIKFMTSSAHANYYCSKTGQNSALLASLQNNNEIYAVQALNAKNWYNPNADETNNIFKDMIGQVNSGKNAQTAIENAASQVTALLQKLQS